MSRWEFHATSRVLSRDGNLSLPQTPIRQNSKTLPPLSSFTELAFMESLELELSRPEEVKENMKASPHQRPKSRSLILEGNSHPFFSSPGGNSEENIVSQDCAPPKPQRNESFIQTQERPSRRCHRRRSRSLEEFFSSSQEQFFCLATKDLSPSKPERIVSISKKQAGITRRRSRSLEQFFSSSSSSFQRDLSPLKPKRIVSISKKQTGITRRRSRSLDKFFFSSFQQDMSPLKPQRIVSGGKNVMMGIDVLTSPPCEESRGKCQPSPSFDVPGPPLDRAESDPIPQAKKGNSRISQLRRTRSLDFTLDFDFLSAPKCEKSRGPCQPKDATPTTEENNNTSRPRRQRKVRRSRSLDPDLRLSLCSHHQKNHPQAGQPESDRNNNNVQRDSKHQRGSRWIIPSSSQRRLMQRVSSLTMEDDFFPQRESKHQRGSMWIIPSSAQRRQMERVSSITMEDDFCRHQTRCSRR